VGASRPLLHCGAITISDDGKQPRLGFATQRIKRAIGTKYRVLNDVLGEIGVPAKPPRKIMGRVPDAAKPNASNLRRRSSIDAPSRTTVLRPEVLTS